MKNRRTLAIIFPVVTLAIILIVIESGTQSISLAKKTEAQKDIVITDQPRVKKTVFIDSNISSAIADINGTLYTLPVKLEVPLNTDLIIRPLPTSFFEPVQSEIKFRVLEDNIVKIDYIKTYVTVNISANAPVQINGTLILGHSSLKVKVNSTLNLNSSCYFIDKYTLICSNTVVIDRGNIEEYYPLNISLKILSDVDLQVNGYKFYILGVHFPVGVLVNGSYVEGSSKLVCPENSTIVISMVHNKNAPIGCREYNNTHYECIKGWILPPWLTNRSLFLTPMSFKVISGGEISEELGFIAKNSSETLVLCTNCGGFRRVEDPFSDYRKVFGSLDRYNITVQNNCLIITTDIIARLFVILPKDNGHTTVEICTKSWHNSIALLYLNGGLYVNIPSFTLQGGCHKITFDLEYAKAYFEGKYSDASRVFVSGLDVVEYSSSRNIVTRETRILPNTGEFALDVYLQGEEAKICLPEGD